MRSHIDAEGQLSPELHIFVQKMAEFERQQGRLPLLKEALALHGTRTTARSRVDILLENNLVAFEGIGVRFIKLTEAGHEAAKWGKVPGTVVYFGGGIHAGRFGGAQEAHAREIHCLSDLLPTNGENEMFYILPVVGDCMAGGRRPIWPGDEVFLKRLARGTRPDNGRVVHVEMPLGDTGETESLLREFYYDASSGLVRLKPRNAAYEEEVWAFEHLDLRGFVLRVLQNEEQAPSASPVVLAKNKSVARPPAAKPERTTLKKGAAGRRYQRRHATT